MALVGLRAQKILTVLLFFIVTQALWAAIVVHFLNGVAEDHGYKFLFDLLGGMAFFIYGRFYLKRKPEEYAKRVRNRITIVLAVFLLIALLGAGRAVYLGAQHGQELLKNSRIWNEQIFIDTFGHLSFSV